MSSVLPFVAGDVLKRFGHVSPRRTAAAVRKAVRSLNRLGIVNVQVRSGALIRHPAVRHSRKMHLLHQGCVWHPRYVAPLVYVLDIVKETQKLIGKGPHPQFLLANLPQAGESVRLEHQKDDNRGADDHEGQLLGSAGWIGRPKAAGTARSAIGKM